MIVAGACHAAAMAAIHATCFAPEQRWREAALADVVALPGVFGLIQPEGGFVLARVAADEAEILTLAVTPGCRRRGYGRSLVEQAARLAAAQAAQAMFLEVSEANHAAAALYARAGFVECGRRRRYYSDGADALTLRKPLTFA